MRNSVTTLPLALIATYFWLWAAPAIDDIEQMVRLERAEATRLAV